MRNETKTLDGVDYFERNKGADHLYVSCANYWTNYVPKDAKWRLNEWKYIISVGCDGNPTILTPHAPDFHIDPEVTEEDFPWIQRHLMENPTWSNNFLWKMWGPEKSKNPSDNVVHHMPPVYPQRKYLVAFAVGKIMDNRVHLFDQCEMAGEEVCRVVRTDRKDMYVEKEDNEFAILDKKAHILTKIKEAYQNSIFCLQPAGDSCSRKGLVDGWVNGCIPVVFSQCSLELYRDYLDSSKAMIFMPKAIVAESRMIEYLKNIPRHLIRDMQFYIISVAHQLQISKIPSLSSFFSLSSPMRSLVQEDSFFTILRVAKKSFDLWKDCERKLNGHYQPIYRICCEKSNFCNPVGILMVITLKNFLTVTQYV
eukprot:GHVP01011754.1.p1 GENE.GHVP01011754.1~~GHVP01011754.1.p1  ORF type:complete len:367 (-),score=55.70 GHVP01011754.1:664-1764(-)